MLKAHGLDKDCPYTSYYLNQAGNGMPVFRGTLQQKGHGLGSLFSSLFKIATPLFKQGGRYIARQALKTGSAIAKDVLAGENLRHSFKQQFENTGRTLVSDTANYLDRIQQGSGRPPHSRVNKKRRLQSKQGIKLSALKRKQRVQQARRQKVKKNKTQHRSKINKKKKTNKKKSAPSKKKHLMVDKLF